MQLSNRLAVDKSRHIDASFQNIGCIGVLVRNGTVHVPAEIGHMLEEMGADNLTGFVSALSSFPTAFARQCHLTDEEFAAARSKIFNDLRINGGRPGTVRVGGILRPRHGSASSSSSQQRLIRGGVGARPCLARVGFLAHVGSAGEAKPFSRTRKLRRQPCICRSCVNFASRAIC